MNNKEFVQELSKLKPASTFLSLIKYRNAYGELSNYSIVFHISYENSLKKSLSFLEKITPVNTYEEIAKQELIDGYNKSLVKIASTPIEKIDDAYSRFFDEQGNYIKGIKLHRRTNTLHLYGLVVHKKIISSGVYPKSNKKPLTLAKDKIRQFCNVNNFRQFKILPSQVEKISVQGLHLLPPTL